MEESTIRKVLKNEFTQIGAIIAIVWFFVNNVIIPINNIQLSLANIQVSLADIKSTSSSLDARITINSNDIIDMKARMTRYNFPQ